MIDQQTTLCTPENECSDPGSRYCRCYRGAGHREAERIAKAAQQTTDCPKCGGVGTYMYDHNHGKLCEVCCPHDQGWWLLSEHYGQHNGMWCCKRGCGEVRADNPEVSAHAR